MKRILKFLILFFILFIIIIVVLLNKYTGVSNDSNKDLIYDNEQNVEIEDNININIPATKENDKYAQTKFEPIKKRKYYIIVENIIIDILDEMRLYNSDGQIELEYGIEKENTELLEKAKQEVLLSLNDKIKSNYNIKEYFSSDIFKNIIMQQTYSINKIYEKNIAAKQKIFIVYGQFSGGLEYSFMIAIDESNRAYEIYLNEYIQENNYTLENIDNIIIDIKPVNKGKENLYSNIDEEEANEQIARRYLILTRTKLESNPEEIYNKLDNTYKKKYNSLEEFKEFAKNAKFSKLKEYRILNNSMDDLIICKDDLNNCVIFRERSVMDYDIILDPYTIELNTIVSEYDSTIDEKKVQMNVEKISQMINMEDYEEIFKRLNKTFKDNNFQDIDALKKYIKKYFYNKNKIETVSIEENDTYYIANIRIINATNELERKLGTIVIKLGEGTDFAMSFSTNY